MKRLNILIGDDGFKGPFIIDLYGIILALWDYSKAERKEKIRKEIENDLIVFNHVPFGPDYSLAFKTVPTVEEMIEEAKKPYDWKVTDMNYGNGRTEGGIEVIEAILPYRREGEVLAVCTSEDNLKMLNRLKELNIDYLINPKLAGFDGTKLELLGKVIAEHYKL